MVRLKNGAEFSGFHYAETGQSIYLAGSFQIDNENLQELMPKILENELLEPDGNLIQDSSKLLKLLKIIKPEDNSIKVVDHRDFVAQVIEGEQVRTGMAYMSWKKEEISAVIPYWLRVGKLLELV